MTSTVYIAKNVYGGDGLGRLGDGRVVFVPGAFTGEQVKAEIVAEKKNFVKARLVEIVESSPERVDGGELRKIPGLTYADLSYKGELEAKEAQLREFLERARIWDGEKAPIVRVQPPEATELNYRNKVVYHFEKQGDSWLIGYREEPSHRVVDIQYDPLAVPAINAKLPEIRRGVIALLTTGPQAVRRDIASKGNVTIRWSEKSGVVWWVGDAPKAQVIREVTCGRTFQVPAGGFYQVNPAVGNELVRAVTVEVSKVMDATEDIIDLYCGVGVFGLCCIDSAKSRQCNLIGIESGREAIEFAKRNAAAQRVDAKFFAAQVGRSLRQLKVTERSVVIVDPPRGGMEMNVAGFLARSKAHRIIYVSCDPATMTRDLKTLCRGYEIESVKWFNMFPRTARFETMVVLKPRV